MISIFRLLVGCDPYEKILLGEMQYGAVCSVKWWVCAAYTTLYVLHRAIVMLQTGGQKVLIVGNITFFHFKNKKNNKNLEL